MTDPRRYDTQVRRHEAVGDFCFLLGLSLLGGVYVLLIAALLVADMTFTTPHEILRALASPEIRYAIQLSLISCSLTAILALWVAVPIGYVMSRFRFPFKGLLDGLLDIPIVLPPLVIGLSLLILFQTAPGRLVERFMPVTYAIPGVILAQFMVACAFAVRTMRVAFDEIDPRTEQVARVMGCSRAQAFGWVVLPEARRGMVTAGTLAWARALGEFGPILVFAGATRLRTEVLPTTVFLELSVGHIEAAVAVSLIMVLAACLVLGIARFSGFGSLYRRAGA